MNRHSIYLCLTLTLLAAPALALEAVPFAGFTGMVLGNPGAAAADVPAKSFVALYALAEFGGPTEVGAMCEIEGPDELLAGQDQDAVFKVTVSLVRQDGSAEQIAKFKMKLREGQGEAGRLRDFQVQPGEYLLFKFKRQGAIQLQAGEQMYLYAYAGAPGVQ